MTVQVAADYSLPFIGTTITLRGSATMRLEQAGDYRRLWGLRVSTGARSRIWHARTAASSSSSRC